jgi:Lon protease-like protein
MLPPTIPIFPLPDTVLFPGVFLPLHIFEPRYRDMVADALVGDRIIGMTLLKPGWQDDYEGRPPVYAVGCGGLITHAETLANGRYNIVLRGLHKFEIIEESRERTYRIARIRTVPERDAALDADVIRDHRRRLEVLLGPDREGATADVRMPQTMPDEELINALAQYLELEPVERQALLERDGIEARGRSLVELLEMKLLSTGHPWPSRGLH